MFIQITFWSLNQQTNLTAYCSPEEQQRENNVGSRFVLELLVEMDLELRLFCQLLLSKVNNEPSSSTFKSTWMTGRSVWTHRTTNTRVKILDHLVFTANFTFSHWFQGEMGVCYGSAAVVRRHRRVKIKPAPPSGPDVCLKRTLSWISFISQQRNILRNVQSRHRDTFQCVCSLTPTHLCWCDELCVCRVAASTSQCGWTGACTAPCCGRRFRCPGPRSPPWRRDAPPGWPRSGDGHRTPAPGSCRTEARPGSGPEGSLERTYPPGEREQELCLMIYLS